MSIIGKLGKCNKMWYNCLLLNTLSKCHGDHPILHRNLKLNSKISTGQYKQKLYLKNADISCCYFVTLAKIQSAREASHHLTLMGNCQIFYLYVPLSLCKGPKRCCCGQIPKCKESVLFPSLIGV